MEQGKKKGKFYCSRCKAIHADGTLRFCADCGGRLVPAEDPRKQSSGVGGMFSRLIKRDEPEEVELDSFGEGVGAQESAPSGVNVPVIRGVTSTASQSEAVAKQGTGNLSSEAATAPLFDPSSSQRQTTELSTGDLVSVTSATPLENSINLSTGPLKFEALGPQAQLTPEQLARLASTGELKLLIGKKISDRFLVNELLAGGLGRATYTAIDLQTNGKVLVQMFPGEAFDARAESNLYGEALRNSAKFRDEDFAVVLGSGRLPDGRVVIISEYVEGNSIAQVIGFAGAFDVNRAARLVRKIADAVNEAHEYGVFHGSLRAENIVLLRPEDLQDKIKIIGLGVALADGEALVAGLPTAADDAYDLSVIAYQMLTGRNPFPGSSAGNSSSLGTVVPVRSIRPELPQQVEYVLSKAMSRISAERYADVRDFGDAFYAALTGGAVSGRLAPRAEEPQVEAGRSERIQVKELFAKEPVVDDAEREQDRAPMGLAEPEPSRTPKFLLAGMALLALLATGGFLIYRYQAPVSVASTPADTSAPKPTEGPISPRSIERPAGSEVFVNNKSKLSGELARSFLPFQVFYPKSFTKSTSLSNFVDLSVNGDGGVPIEKFIATSYPSDGTFEKDKGNFAKIVEKSNSELRGILGEGYKALSQGETALQDGRLRAYEVKFEFDGELGGRQTKLWGRRLWVPLQKDGAKFGFVLTLIASDLSKDVKGVEDLGGKGALKAILDSFEPGQ